MSSTLIDTIQEAEGGSREVDRAVMREAGLSMSMIGLTVPSYTTSLDAIVALIGEKLPGWGVTIRMELAPYVQTCELCAPDDPNAALTDPRPFRASGGAKTAPLACCIALLLALQSQEPTP